MCVGCDDDECECESDDVRSACVCDDESACVGLMCVSVCSVCCV